MLAANIPMTSPSATPPSSSRITSLDLFLILLVTCSWGLNYPIMKFVVTEYPPSSFRALTFILGTCVLGLYARSRGESLWVPPEERWTTLRLSIPNMVLWHVGLVYGISMLNSGRAAIIGYTMPVWALLASVLLFKDRFTWRGTVGVVLALCATLLLAIEEFSSLVGQPIGLALMLVAAMGWGLGTAMMRNLHVSISNAALTLWMMTITFCAVMVGSVVLELPTIRWPHTGEWMAIIYNAIIVFGFCHIAWFRLARKLPPVASSLSIMLIPPLGVFSGAWSLGETVGPFDLAALALILLSMAVVLLPRRSKAAGPGPSAEPQ